MNRNNRNNLDPVSQKQKNGSVELLRFLFTSIIIFFHINLDLWDQQKVIASVRGVPVTFFMHGNIAVEFFFLVTGWLMAASVYRRKESEYRRIKKESICGGQVPERAPGVGARRKPSCGTKRDTISGEKSCRTRRSRACRTILSETLQFVTHKAQAVMPYYLTACVLTPLARLAAGKVLSADYFLRRLPSLLFLQRAGLGKPFIGCTWYLSSMLLALALAYPLCRCFYRFYTRFAGPVLGCLLLWMIIEKTGTLGEIDDWFFVTYKTNVRAFAEISIGAASFECSRLLNACFRSDPSLRDQSHEAELRLFRRVCRTLLSLTALLCLTLSVAYMCSSLDGAYALIVVALLSIAVTITFSGEGILCRAGAFNHPAFSYLGAISLPMYVSQTILRMTVQHWFARSTQWTQCLLIYIGVLALGVTLHALVPHMRIMHMRIMHMRMKHRRLLSDPHRY